jgi:probable HAF family extracellular repeat protein
MSVRKHVAIGAAVFIVMGVFTIGNVASSAPTYVVAPIDPPDGFTHVYPTHINAVGEVVGTALSTDNAVQHAFESNGGTSTDLGTLGGAASSARGVNDAGVVVGEAGTGGLEDEVHAVIWTDGFVSDLGDPGHASAAASINAHGMIVGYESDQLGSNHAVLWDNKGVNHRLDRFRTGYSSAVSMNDADQVLLTGVPAGAGGSPESFLWEGGRLTGLGPIEGTGINAWGDVIGYQSGPSLDLPGVFWRAGSTRLINGPS